MHSYGFCTLISKCKNTYRKTLYCDVSGSKNTNGKTLHCDVSGSKNTDRKTLYCDVSGSKNTDRKTLYCDVSGGKHPSNLTHYAFLLKIICDMLALKTWHISDEVIAHFMLPGVCCYAV